jgi:hypothetical protein
MMLSNLGLALRSRFERTGSAVDLDAAVEAGQTAAAIAAENDPGRAMLLANLAPGHRPCD